MQKYILEFQNGNLVSHAGYKAPADIGTILSQNGYKKKYVKTLYDSKIKSLFGTFLAAIDLIFSFMKECEIVVQYPIYSKKGKVLFSLLQKFKRKNTIYVALIHDVVRPGKNQSESIKEIDEFNKFDYLIVHSSKMEAYLRELGCKTNCIVMGLFDYLVSQPNAINRQLSGDITYVGNLLKSKFFTSSGLLLSQSVKFHLYGNRIPEYESSTNVVYEGCFSSDDVSDIKGSWGLVWDGTSVDGINGIDGEYQKINSPHKASLYIVAGLPLIVHRDSAISSIVTSRKIGIVISSLLELETAISQITGEEYNQIIQNVNEYASHLLNGQNVMEALSKIS